MVLNAFFEKLTVFLFSLYIKEAGYQQINHQIFPKLRFELLSYKVLLDREKHIFYL